MASSLPFGEWVKACLYLSYNRESMGWWLQERGLWTMTMGQPSTRSGFLWIILSSDRINQPRRWSSLNRKNGAGKKKKLMQSRAVLNRTKAIYFFPALLQERFNGTINNSGHKQVDENFTPLLVSMWHIEESPKFHKKKKIPYRSFEKLEFMYLVWPGYMACADAWRKWGYLL